MAKYKHKKTGDVVEATKVEGKPLYQVGKDLWGEETFGKTFDPIKGKKEDSEEEKKDSGGKKK